jgi:hypothetical protein
LDAVSVDLFAEDVTAFFAAGEAGFADLDFTAFFALFFAVDAAIESPVDV